MACSLCGSNESRYITSHREFAGAEIRECSSCGFVFATGVDDQILDAYYATQYRVSRHESPEQVTYQRDANTRAQAQFNYITTHIRLPVDARVVEIGCAGGTLLERFAGAGYRVSGCDPDLAMSEYARTRALDVLTGTLSHFRAQRGERLSDLLILSHVFEHFLNPVEALKEAATLVIPGGAIFIEVPNDTPSKVAWMAAHGSTSAHLSFFNPTTIRHAVESAGLAVVVCHTAGPPTTSLYPTFGRRLIRAALSLRLSGGKPVRIPRPDIYSHPRLAFHNADPELEPRVALRVISALPSSTP